MHAAMPNLLSDYTQPTEEPVQTHYIPPLTSVKSVFKNNHNILSLYNHHNLHKLA